MTRANQTIERLDVAVPRPPSVRSGEILARIPEGLAAAYRNAFAGRRLAWASPAVFTVGSYLAFYGAGLIFANPSPHFPAITYAVAVGLGALLAGIGLGWRAVATPIRLAPVPRRLLTRYGLLLLAVGLVALVAYFVKIGYVPLFQAGLEQSRVEAADEGGAPLRVLSLLSLPGTWILVAQSVVARDRRGILLAALAVAGIAVGFALTGNRSPAFLVVEVALISGLLAAGIDRIGGRAVALLAVVGIVFILGAGLYGAFRLASRGEVYGPPVPNAIPPPANYPALTVIAIKGYLVVPVQNLGYTIDAVPGQIGWRFGLTYIQPLLTVLPGKQTTIDGDLKAALNQHYAGGGTVPGLLGEAYANFGPIGWIVIPLLAGAAITMLYRSSMRAGPALAVLYAYAIVHVSIGGVLSGLVAASVFPFEAYAVLGFGVFALPIVGRRFDRSGGAGP